MEKIYYNKLCRDKVPTLIETKGFTCEVRTVDHDEYRREIVRKLYEEASGVSDHSNREYFLKQLADLEITLAAVKKEFAISEAEIALAVSRSLEEKGGYDNRLYLSWSSDVEYQSHDRGQGFDD
jgi:predicted house-cleaning noncanonical NTP pyrophosphatase (MazG superfamily)